MNNNIRWLRDKIKMLDNIKNGKALKKFEEMVKNQGGDTEYLENTSKFPRAKYIEAIKAKQSGYICFISHSVC